MTRGYVAKVLLALDVFACLMLFRDQGVTISAETGLALRRAQPPRWAKVLGWVLDHLQKDHCANAILHDIERAKIAIDYLSAKP